MKRLTTDAPKDNLEAALNLFYIKDYETWVRGYGPAPEYADVSLFDITRDIVKTHIPDAELPEDNDNLSNMMPEWLMDGIDSAEGVVALLYTAAWAYAELRHKLMRYEDTGLEPCDYSAMQNALQKAERAQSDLTEMIRIIGNVGLESLQELAKAEQAGLLVMLPCKVDDTVYVINRHLNRVFECTVISISVGRSTDLKNYIKTKWVGPNGNESIRKWSLRQVGKYVFMTREAAEVALAVKDGAPPDAPEEPAEPEWKSRVMRTILGVR